MEIKVGDLIFGETSDYHLSPSIDGLESPKIRTGDGLYAGRDYGFMSGHYYSYRTIVLKGFFIGNNCENTVQLSNTLFNYLRIRKTFPIVVNMQDEQYYIEGYVMDVKSDYTSNKIGEFQITIACPDPVLYLAENDKPIVKSITLTDGYSNKNLLDKTATPVLKANNKLTLTPLDTGVRVGWSGSAQTNVWGWNVYLICKASEVVGKNFTLSADVSVHNTSNTACMYIGVADINGNNRVSKANTSTISGDAHKSISWTVSGVNDSQYIIAVIHNGYTSTGTNNDGDYVDYENLTMTIGDEPSEYTDFGKVYATVYNDGAIMIYPKIISTGVIDGLEITNATLEKSFQTSTRSSETTDETIIDMDKRLITLNGNIRNADRTPASEWWGLEIEDNNIVLNMGDSNASAILEYKEGVMGI